MFLLFQLDLASSRHHYMTCFDKVIRQKLKF